MPMRQLRSLVIQLLALLVLADAFALGRDQTLDRTESSDTGQDQTPSGSAAQHITKIPRSKDKGQNKLTGKAIETITIANVDTKTKEPADTSNEIEDGTAKPIVSSPEAHGPGNDEARIAVASNGTNDVTHNMNVTDTPTQSSSVLITNTTPKENKEPDDPNWVPEAVSEVNSETITETATVTLTSVDSESHYSTATVNDNEDSANITTVNSEERQHQRGKITSENVTDPKDSVSALVAEYTQANAISLRTTEEPFKPYQGTTSKEGLLHDMSSQNAKAFEEKLANNTSIQEPRTVNVPSTDLLNVSHSNSRTTEWLRSADSDLATTIANTKYDKVITKEERLSDMGISNTLETTSNAETSSTVVPKSPSAMKENEGPLDDVTMDTSNSWRREDTVVTSMRGGYLNHSPEANKEATTKSDVDRSDEENKSAPTKKTESVASQSQMVDDQIKDELMMEDLLSEGQKNGEERPLSVRPIGKNNALYTVSPNYKPMPKLDVVPGKQQLRNPDDNSWRNQSLNNLGIVFKGHNSTKPFTQVLKNKTETELSNLVEKDDKTEAPELRERLEKLAEERKSKKKKSDKNGESIEYDDASSYYFYKTTTNSPSRVNLEGPKMRPTTLNQPHQSKVSPHRNIFNHYDYESRDDDIDYVTLPYIDLQKASTTKTPDRSTTTRFPTTRNWAQPTTRAGTARKATVQYFPPKVYMKNDSEVDAFHSKMEAFEPELDAPITTANLVLKDKESTPVRTNFYLPDKPKTDLTAPYRVPANKAYSFRDIMTKLGHEEDYDRINEYVPLQKVKQVLTQRDHANFGKGVQKFMQNYNDNSKRFRVDFPVVYNSRILHTDGTDYLPASSSASVKQQYYNSASDGKHILEQRKKCDPNCDKIVELSADYELHYYLPDQEERQLVISK